MGFDILALCILFLYMLLGLLNGVLKTSLAFAFLIVSLFLSAYVNPICMGFIKTMPIINNIAVLKNPTIIYILTLFVVSALLNVIRPLFNMLLNKLHLSFSDYLFGCLVGLVEGLVFMVIVTAIFYYINLPDFIPINKLTDNSLSYAYFTSVCDQISVGWSSWIKNVR